MAQKKWPGRKTINIFLNQARVSFLEIDFVHDMYVCLCLSLRLLITSGMI